MSRFLRFLTPVLVGFFLYHLPVPEGLNPKGWHLFSIFVSMILGLILKPFPMGVIALLGVLTSVLLNILNLHKDALSAYSSPIVWMVVYIFFVARGFVNTPLGDRLAYFFVKSIGKRTLGLGYGIVLTELLIAPFIPSNSARTGGIMFPVLKSISVSMGSSPEKGTQRRVGAFLTQVCFHGNLATSAMFLTAMAANPIIQDISMKQGIEITWLNWFVAALVPGLLSLIILPFLIYVIYPPEKKYVPEAIQMAKEKLADMGKMGKKELTMLVVFLCMLFLWVTGDFWGISACTTAMLGFCALLMTGVISWNDVLGEKEAWNTLIWLSILIMISSNLEKLGFISWFSESVAAFVTGWHWHYSFLLLSLIYFYSHYFFASNTAHVTSMFSAFLAILIATGTPPMLAALTLGFFSSIFSSMTHYGTSAGVVLFGTGYVSLPVWWGLGFITSIVNILIWMGVGSLWWKFLGFWS